MNQQLAKLKYNINTAAIEFRVALLILFLAIIFVLWYALFWHRLYQDIVISRNKIEKTQLAIKKAKEQLLAKRSESEGDFKTKLSAGKVISPNKMIEVFEDILTNRYQLVLVKLINSPPVAVTLLQLGDGTEFYEHHITMQFKGGFFETMNYLKALESMGWKIFWDKFEYSVIEYPIANVTLSVHTISGQENLIHV